MRIALALLLVLAAGCDSTDPAPEPIDPGFLVDDPALLVGTWDWVESTFYYTVNGPAISTPATTGWSATFTFRADSTYVYQSNGGPPSSGMYTVHHRAVYGEDDLWLGDYGVNERYLLLSTSAVDGPDVLYRRRAE